MDKKLEQSLKSQLSSKTSKSDVDTFVDRLSSFHAEIDDLLKEAIEPMQKTITNCFGEGDIFVGNVVQYDYILKRASKTILGNKSRSLSRGYVYENAQRAVSLIFNQYRYFKFEEKYLRLIEEFKKKNKNVLSHLDKIELIDKVVPKYDKFLDKLLDLCKEKPAEVTNNKIKTYLKNYNTLFADLFVKHQPSKQIGLACEEMIKRLKGKPNFSLTYNDKTGQLTGFPEIVIGDKTSIEEADMALNYYIACSEYVEKQKIAIILQLASNRNFAKSVCYPQYKDSYTDLISKTTNALADKAFGQFFGELSLRWFDDIETLKKKSMSIEHVRSLLVSVSSFLEINKQVYLDNYRRKHELGEEASNEEVLNMILDEKPNEFYQYLNNLVNKIDKIVNISIENPITSNEQIEKQIQLFTKYSTDILRQEPGYFKEYLNLSREGYRIIIPSGLDIGKIKSAVVKSLINNEIKSVTSSAKKIVSAKVNVDFKTKIKNTIDDVFFDTIGLGALKDKLFEQVYALKVLPANSNFRNLAFILSGNPGSGKTMTARKIHEVLIETGILTNNMLFDDIAASLKAKYVGQTTDRIQKIYNAYAGGTIFIDEADSLFGVGHNNEDAFTGEARSKFIKLVEDNSKHTATIMACYRDKLPALFKSNPGIFRRFASNIYELPDYAPTELVEMCELMLKIDAAKTGTSAFVFAKDAREELKGYFEYVQNLEDEEYHKENASIVSRTISGVLEKKILRSGNDQEISLQDVRSFVDDESYKHEVITQEKSGIRIIGVCE